MAKQKRAVLYIRVSTDMQDTAMQETELRKYVETRGWTLEKIYADRGISGATKDKRPALDEMMADCAKRKFEICLVWALDRLGRSLKDLLSLIEEFRQRNIDFICLKQDIDTTTSAGRLLFHIVGSVAEYEREMLRSRVKSGMAEARRRGAHIGRPPLRRFSENEIAQLCKARQQDGASIRQLAMRHGTTQWMVQKILAGQNAAS